MVSGAMKNGPLPSAGRLIRLMPKLLLLSVSPKPSMAQNLIPLMSLLVYELSLCQMTLFLMVVRFWFIAPQPLLHTMSQPSMVVLCERMP